MGIVFVVRRKAAKGEGMADGMWTMSEDGEFHLEEPYRTWLEEAKVESTSCSGATSAGTTAR